MNDNEIYERLNQLFRDFFNDQGIVLQAHSTTADIPRWDSLNHVQIIIKIEAAFGIRFKHAEIARFQNVGDMAAAISRRVNP
jgi:acyl carrier protein